MVELTFPQPGDLPDAAYFAFATGRARSGIISGLTFVADFTVPEVTVDPGKAVIDRGDMTTVHPNIDPPETVSDAVAVVEIESQTVALASGTLNHIFLDANVANDDSGTVVANTTGAKPTNASLKIGEVDTSVNSVSEQFNKIEDDGTLSFPDADSANGALSSLPDGVGVIDRANKVLIYDDKVSVATLEADAIVDGSDVSHSGELADIADVSPIQSSSDITVTDTQVGTVGDGEFLTNSGGSLTGGTVQTEPNIPGFEKDPNNPIGGSLSTSHTITLSKSYKFIKVIVLDFDPLANRTDLFMRINGISTDTYDVRDKSGSSTFGANKIKLSRMNDDFVAPSGEIHINGATTDVAGIGGQNFVHSNEFVTDRADEFGIQNTEGSDVNSIELFTTTGDQFNPTVRVYGLN